MKTLEMDRARPAVSRNFLVACKGCNSAGLQPPQDRAGELPTATGQRFAELLKPHDDDMRCAQVCNVAGNATTVRSAEPPYSYNNRESRRAARQRAEMFAQLIDEADLDVVLASAWPGGWQSRIKSVSHKARPLPIPQALTPSEFHPFAEGRASGKARVTFLPPTSHLLGFPPLC